MINNYLARQFSLLGMLKEATNSASYSFQPTPPRSQLDIHKFLSNQAYWKTLQRNKAAQKRKLILNAQQFFSLNNGPQNWNYLLSFLKIYGFQFFILNAAGKLEEICYPDDILKIFTINIADEQVIYNAIESAQQNVDDYFIIGNRRYDQIVDQFMPHFTDLTDVQPQSSDNLILNLSNKNAFNANNLQKWLELVEARQFSRLIIYLENSAQDSKTFLTIKPNCTVAELKYLIKLLAARLTNISEEMTKIDSFVEEISVASRTLKYVNVTGLTNLKKLKIDCHALEKIENIEQLTNLQELELNADIFLPKLASHLKKLTISRATVNNLCTLKDLENFSVEELIVDVSNPAIKEICIPELNLQSLKTLYLSKKKPIIKLKNPHLKELHLHDAILPDFSLDNYPELERLFLRNCEITLSAKQLANLKYLRELSIDKGKQMQLAIDSYEQISQVKDLHLGSEYDVAYAEFLTHLNNLTRLSLSRMPIRTLNLAYFKDLQTLRICNCKALTALLGSDQCKTLRSLKIINCPKFATIRLSEFPALESLEIVGGESLQIINDLTATNRLQKLIIWHSLTDLNLKNLDNLTSLSLSMSNITSLNVQHLTKLKKLELDLLPKLTYISGLEQLSNLSFAKLRGIPNIKDCGVDFSYRNFFNATTEVTGKIYELRNNTVGAVEGGAALPMDFSETPVTPELRIDFATKTQPGTELTAEIIYATVNPQTQDADFYREQIYSSLDLTADGQIILRAEPLGSGVLYNVPQKNNEPTVPGSKLLQLYANESYVLPGISTKDQLFNLSDKDNFDVYYHPNTQQYRLQLKKNVTYYKNYIQWEMAAKNYLVTSITDPLSPNISTKCLPPAIKQALDNFFANTNKAEFKALLTMNQEQRLRWILDYASYRYTDEDLLQSPTNDVDGLVMLLDEHKGACRHRAYVVLALAQYFNLPLQLVGNPLHLFIQVAVQTKNGTEWLGYDTGGTDVPVKLVYPKPITPTINLAPAMPSQADIEMEIAAEAMETTDAYGIETFLHTPDWLPHVNNFAEVLAEIFKENKPYLIKIPDTTYTRSYHAALWQYTQKQKIPCVFIDTPNELIEWFDAIKINQTSSASNELYTHVAGPLKELLLNQTGLIVINWSNFTANQRLIYKSLLEDPPTFEGHLLADNIHVLGLLAENIPANDVFLTRTTAISLPASLVPAEWHYTNVQQAEDAIEINLYHSEDWYGLLIPGCKFNGSWVNVCSSQFLDALRLGKKITLVNPPETQEFKAWLERLIIEKKLFVNGATIDAKQFQCAVRLSTTNLETPAQIIFAEDIKNTKSGKLYFINQNAYDSLFSAYHICKNGIYSKPGILELLGKDDQLVFTEKLSADLWQRIYDHIKANKELCQKTFHITTATKVYQPKHLPAINAFNTSYIATDDVEFALASLQQSKKINSKNIFYLSALNTWAEDIENIDLSLLRGHLNAKQDKQAMLKLLLAGETVVLAGTLSPEDYQALQTLLLQPPYIFVNGKRCEVKGKLLIINNASDFTPWMHPWESYTANLQDYKNLLLQQIPQDNHRKLENVYRYFGYLPEEHRQLEKVYRYFVYLAAYAKANPDWLPAKLNYAKFKACFAAYGSTTHDNPLQQVLHNHLDKKHQGYAYSAVLAKILLPTTGHDNVHLEKLSKITAKLQSYADFQQNFWAIANCLSPAYLQTLDIEQLPLADDGLPILDDVIFKRLLQTVMSYVPAFGKTAWVAQLQLASNPISVQKSTTNEKKALHELFAVIDAKKHPLICLLGPSGTGKSHARKKLKKQYPNAHFYFGEKNIPAFFADNTTEKKFLILDEFNLQSRDKFEFLEGMFTEPRIIRHAGKTYHPRTNAYIIGMGNTLEYTGRKLQDVVWQHAYTIAFNPYKLAFIKKKTIKYLQADKDREMSLAVNKIITAYEYLASSCILKGVLSLRDIKNICMRTKLLHSQLPNWSWNDVAAAAIYDEINGLLIDKQSRAALKNFLQVKAIPVAHSYADTDFVLPQGMQKTWRRVLDDLALRNWRYNNQNNYLGKLGLVLEGSSGVGKTTLLIKLLESQGFVRNHPDPAKRYQQITAGSAGVRDLLLTAFREGSIVILDELNADQDEELIDLLNQLLTGEYLDGNPAKQAGFMVFATQNPAYYDGCSNLCKSKLSRLRKIDVRDYREQDLLFLAKTFQHPKPSEFVHSFFRLQKQHPEINTRSFFHALKNTRRMQH